MILTDKGHLSLDMWPKTAQQAESTENIIRATLNKKAICWQKASKRSDFLLFLTDIKIKHLRALLFCNCYQQNS